MNNILIVGNCSGSINPLQLLKWFDGDLKATAESILLILKSNFRSGKLTYINLNVQFERKFYVQLKSLLKLYNVKVYSNDNIDGIKTYEYSDAIIDKIYNNIDDYNCYNRIIVVSDLHGNYKMLELLLDRYRRDHIIMLGDNVDKGYNSGLIIKMLLQHNGSIEYLWGNHEWKLWQHIISRQLGIQHDYGNDDDINRTITEIKSCGLKYNDVIRFLSKHQNYKRFRKNGILYNLCHGGVKDYMTPIQHNYRIKNFIKGDGNRTDDIAELWSGDGIQVHGHRDCSTTDNNICLNNVVNADSILVAEITDNVIVKTLHK